MQFDLSAARRANIIPTIPWIVKQGHRVVTSSAGQHATCKCEDNERKSQNSARPQRESNPAHWRPPTEDQTTRPCMVSYVNV